MLLSVGYSACHWCHVMERESFENEDIAGLMNRLFVNIKVDREERPDVDQIYMQAVQSMTGRGGWPMTVFLTPDGTPFYGGTYFPPVDRHGMPGFPALARVHRRRLPLAARRGGGVRPQAPRGDAPGRAPPALGERARRGRPPRRLSGTRGSIRRAARRARAGAEVPAADDLGVPPALRQAHGRSARARDGAASRSTAWRRAGCTTSSAAASTATPSTISGSCRTSRRCSTTMPSSPRCISMRWLATGDPTYRRVDGGDARLPPRGDAAPVGRILLRPGRRLRGRRGEVLRLVARRDQQRCSATTR